MNGNKFGRTDSI